MRTVSDELLQQMAERLAAELHPEEILLFGSRAWGTPCADSDVDLLIILPAGTEDIAGHELTARRGEGRRLARSLDEFLARPRDSGPSV